MQQRSRPSFYRRRTEAAAAMVVVCNGGRIIKSDSPPASKKQKNPAITALIIALPFPPSDPAPKFEWRNILLFFSLLFRLARFPHFLFLSLSSLFPPFLLGSMNGGTNEQDIIFLPVLYQTFDFFFKKLCCKWQLHVAALFFPPRQ